METKWKVLCIAVTTLAIAGTGYYLYNPSISSSATKPASSKKRQKKESTGAASGIVASPLERAKAAKNSGNKLFAEKNYPEAIVYYTEAINIDAQAVYFNNRAACHYHLKDYEQVIADCSDALSRDPMYVKAMNRRAGTYELLSDYQNALDDYSALCVLEEFKNQNTMECADRVLKIIGTNMAAELIKGKSEHLPSDSFITAYMESFRQTSTKLPDLLELETVTDADKILHEALINISKKKYKLAMDNVNKSIETADQTPGFSKEFEALAYNLRGTFRFMVGNIDGALEDFNQSIAYDASNIDAYIKRASVYMEQGQYEKTIQEFEEAEAVDSSVGDYYYHRGQVRHLTGNLPGSVSDFKHALVLDPSLVYAQIQLGVALYKQDDVEGAIKAFHAAEIMFPGRAEVLNYQGEIFLDQGNQEKALKCFDKSIKMEPNSALPYINKGMLYLQMRGDPTTAETLFKKAIELDPLSDIAYGPLAQLYLTQNKIQDAIAIYNRAVEFARTEQEIVAAVCCREAAKSQLNIGIKYPAIMKKLEAAQKNALAARSG